MPLRKRLAMASPIKLRMRTPISLLKKEGLEK
jgi:hypothetical protein